MTRKLRVDPETARAAKHIVHKTISRVNLQVFDPNDPDHPDNYEYLVSDPQIVFTDGSVLQFVVEETEVGEYGLSMTLRPRRQAKKASKRTKR